MDNFNPSLLKDLYVPPSDSHKGQNGKVLVIGGSHLFHSSAFWSLEVASKIVDMVYFSSTPMNNEIVKKLKTKFINGIIVSRDKVGEYIEEADVTLIGPGLPRPSGQEVGDDDTKILTEKLLLEFKNKKWVIDGGSLQVIRPEIIPKNSIITPNTKEFLKLFDLRFKINDLKERADLVSKMSKKYNLTILLKGEVDMVCGPFGSAQGEIRCIRILGGNAGMTKGGTGDVLAGLTAALYVKNDAFLSAVCASYINKKAGEEIYKTKGIYFNSSDLVKKIPEVMKKQILD